MIGVVLDFVGGLLSLLQAVLDSANSGEYNPDTFREIFPTSFGQFPNQFWAISQPISGVVLKELR